MTERFRSPEQTAGRLPSLYCNCSGATSYIQIFPLTIQHKTTLHVQQHMIILHFHTIQLGQYCSGHLPAVYNREFNFWDTGLCWLVLEKLPAADGRPTPGRAHEDLQRCSAAPWVERRRWETSPKNPGKPAWLQHTQESSHSHKKHGTGERKIAPKFQYLTRCFCKIPQ